MSNATNKNLSCRYGLIGYPLGHSFSERYFGEKFAAEGIAGCSYENFPIASIEALPELLASRHLDGFNVTIPYKQAVLPYLDAIDPEAAQVGAVNCVKVVREGGSTKLTGYNTDIYGFRISLLELLGKDRPRALVLGTGGASKAVEHVLRTLGISYTIVSRSAEATTPASRMTYAAVTPRTLKDNPLIINATPLGTYPDTESAPLLPYEGLTSANVLYDLVYNPPVTRFLRYGEEVGARTANGYRMLVLQAERSWEIWREDAK